VSNWIFRNKDMLLHHYVDLVLLLALMLVIACIYAYWPRKKKILRWDREKCRKTATIPGLKVVNK
jgi:uncharacterized iron-regulated membrane protein